MATWQHRERTAAALSDGQKSPAALLTRRPKGVTFVRLESYRGSLLSPHHLERDHLAGSHLGNSLGEAVRALQRPAVDSQHPSSICALAAGVGPHYEVRSLRPGTTQMGKRPPVRANAAPPLNPPKERECAAPKSRPRLTLEPYFLHASRELTCYRGRERSNSRATGTAARS